MNLWTAKTVKLLTSGITFLVCPQIVFAYIDPGTTSIVFSSLAYLLGILGAFIGILIWPFRRFFHYLNAKLKRKGWALGICVSTLVIVALIGTTVVYLII